MFRKDLCFNGGRAVFEPSLKYIHQDRSVASLTYITFHFKVKTKNIDALAETVSSGFGLQH